MPVVTIPMEGPDALAQVVHALEAANNEVHWPPVENGGFWQVYATPKPKRGRPPKSPANATVETRA